jgi:hypothetical protein
MPKLNYRAALCILVPILLTAAIVMQCQAQSGGSGGSGGNALCCGGVDTTSCSGCIVLPGVGSYLLPNTTLTTCQATPVVNWDWNCGFNWLTCFDGMAQGYSDAACMTPSVKFHATKSAAQCDPGSTDTPCD